MRLQTFLALITASIAFPSLLLADDNSVTVLGGKNANVTIDKDAAYKAGAMIILEGKDPFTNRKAGETINPKYELNEMAVDRLEGTIVVQHPGDAKPTALQTFSTVEKGDTLTVYDKGWVILKDHKGDRIGLDGGTVVTIDEFFIAGPDRQVRFLFQKGALYLKTNNCNSRQSFFEINAGQVVTAIGDVQAILTYTPQEKEHLRVEYMTGKINVIDKNREEKFQLKESHYDPSAKQMKEEGVSNQHIEHNWENGLMVDANPVPLQDIDGINYKRFFDGEPLLVPSDSNILLDDSHSVAPRYR